MFKNENIICISSIDWDFVWQGHQEIMAAYAAAGNRVLFIENTGIRMPNFRDFSRIRKRVINWIKSVKGFRKERDNLYLYSPLFLPFPYSHLVRWINKYLILTPLRRWLDIMKFDNPIIWTFLPTGIALDIIDSIKKKALVYYYIADFDQLTRNPKKLKKTEERLIRECDIIFVQGEYFRNRCLKFNKNVFNFPFGVNHEAFEDFKAKDKGATPDDLQNIPHPIIGYVGGVHRHIDFELIYFLAKNNPDFSIVLIGPIQVRVVELKSFKNVYFIDQKPFLQLPAYINQFDVCVVPYLLSDYTNTVYPTKINEYHMLGKPVVSTALPEVIKADKNNLVCKAYNHEEFYQMIRQALEENSPELLSARIAAAKDNSWQNRIREMSERISTAIEGKEEVSLRWQEKFLEIYRISRRRMVKFVSVLVLVWFVVFYTSFVWFLAEPLRFHQAPQASDAIVVFAGGVGESGRPGQGYEERVKHSVDLYKKGLAEYIIFSSGDKNIYPEPYLMKTLVLSLGIPEHAVVIEDKAASTYENVKFTAEILNKKGWDKIILVSSPYHMRRARFVFQKVAPGKEVIYSPSDSLFYYRDNIGKKGLAKLKQINLRQIKAILHEYLAIIYYFFKGYI